MSEYIVVYVTAGSAEEGERLARALVEERLAACVNRVAPVRSVYRWEGKIEQSEEELLIVKSRRDLFPVLEKRVRELHGYEVPEVIALPVVSGSEPYLRWLSGELTAPGPGRGGLRTVREVSAGGIVFRRRGGAYETVLIRVRHRWTLPKGHVEEGESTEQAALREVREETGLEGAVVQKLGDIRYSYRDKSKEGEAIRIYKRVFFYLLRYVKGDVRDHDHEVEEARWFPMEQAIRRLKFATERKMVHRALSVLEAEDGGPEASAQRRAQSDR
ncbi:MAG TPA: divalent cation tolerance protein CutA [candidate division Zixibacteria bacterium]|nr:divalent cation tolerance protein CutA [candidate division Zixibacteria bacterium]